MEMRKQTEERVVQILDTFTGADGGVSFMAFRCLVEEMDARAAKGDKVAEEVLLTVTRFSRLLKTAVKYYGPNTK